jgi:hypothetical protein
LPPSAAPGAFYTGIVKVQQRLATEVFHIGGSEGFSLLNFPQSRDK